MNQSQAEPIEKSLCFDTIKATTAPQAMRCSSRAHPNACLKVCMKELCHAPAFLCSDSSCDCCNHHIHHIDACSLTVAELATKVSARSHPEQLIVQGLPAQTQELIAKATNKAQNSYLLNGEQLRECLDGAVFLGPEQGQQPKQSSLRFLPILNMAAICLDQLRSTWSTLSHIEYRLQSADSCRLQNIQQMDEWTNSVSLFRGIDKQARVTETFAELMTHQQVFPYPQRIKDLTLNCLRGPLTEAEILFLCNSLPAVEKLTLFWSVACKKFHSAWLPNISSLWMADARGMVKLQNLKFSDLVNLTVVKLDGIQLTEEHGVELAALPYLRDATFANNNIGAEWYQHICKLKVRALAIERNNFDDETLRQLTEAPALKGLTSLQIRYSPVTSVALNCTSVLTRLTAISFDECLNLNDSTLVIGKHHPSLTRLILKNCRLTHLKGLECLTQLKELAVGNNQLEQGSLSCVQFMTQLEGLDIDGFDLTDRDSCYLRNLRNLDWLSCTSHTGGSWEWLRGLTKLTSLYHSYTQLEGSLAKHLSFVNSLRQVVLQQEFKQGTSQPSCAILECVRALSSLPLLRLLSIHERMMDDECGWLISRIPLRQLSLDKIGYAGLSELRRLSCVKRMAVTCNTSFGMVLDVSSSRLRRQLHGKAIIQIVGTL